MHKSFFIVHSPQKRKIYHKFAFYQKMDVIYLIFAVCVGAGLGAVLGRQQKVNKLLLTFSGAYLLGINVFEVLPLLYHSSMKTSTIGLVILMGIFIQIIIEGFTKGVEHGHIHKIKNSDFTISIFLGLFLHALIEGMPVSNEEGKDLLWAIIVHKIPIAMILYTFLSTITQKVWKIALFMSLFALASPIGYWIGANLSDYYYYALALTSGVFLHISTVIIFESGEGHNLKFQKIAIILVGFSMAYLISH